MKKGTIDASPAPGALFEEALTQFEEAVHRFVTTGVHNSYESPAYKAAQAHYQAKRVALTDYVGQLERFYTAHV